MVADYTGLNILDVLDLDLFDYLQYRKDAFVYELNKTEKGQEYLDNAYRLEQTKPDKKSLREHFGGGG